MRVNLSASNRRQSAPGRLGQLILAIGLFPSASIAAEFGSEIDAQSQRNAALSSGIQIDYLLQVFLSLALVIGIIVLLSFVLKKINLQARTGSGAIRILSVVPLGAKDRLLLVAVGEEQLLLGSSPGSVQKLHTLDKPIDAIPDAEPVASDRNFMSVLNSVTRGQGS